MQKCDVIMNAKEIVWVICIKVQKTTDYLKEVIPKSNVAQIVTKYQIIVLQIEGGF